MLNLQTLLQKKKGENTAENNRCKKKARRKRTAMLSMAAVGVIPFLAPPVGTDSSVFAWAAAAGSIDGLFGDKEPAVTGALAAAVAVENEEAAKATKAYRLATEEPNTLVDSYRLAAGYTAQTWKSIARSIQEKQLPDVEGELILLGLWGEDGLLENDVVIDTGRLWAADGLDKSASGQAKAIPTAVDKSGKATSGSVSAVDEPSGADETEPEAEPETGAEAAAAEEEKAKEAFLANTSGGTPAALSVKYNAEYAALKLSTEQLTVLETIVEAEAGDEDVYGKILVANVVLNRVLDKEFPNTVKEVVFQNNGKTYQFSPVRKGGRYYTVKVSEHTKTAVARALVGEDYSEGALYFFARRYTSANKANWFDTSLRKIVEYGCHEFFGNK